MKGKQRKKFGIIRKQFNISHVKLYLDELSSMLRNPDSKDLVSKDQDVLDGSGFRMHTMKSKNCNLDFSSFDVFKISKPSRYRSI